MIKYFTRFRINSQADHFSVSGWLPHWTVTIPPLAWFYLGFPLVANRTFLQWILYGLIAAGVALLYGILFRFKISIDRKNIVIKKMFCLIAFKTIRSALNDLIILHLDAKGLTLISPEKSSTKDGLRFECIIPFDGDKPEFYIDYNNKEVDMNGGEKLFLIILDGIRSLETNQTGKV